jgi:chaperone required for assembly of F1-ATPase
MNEDQIWKMKNWGEIEESIMELKNQQVKGFL